MTSYVTRAGKITENVHGLFWATGKKKNTNKIKIYKRVKNDYFSRIWCFLKNEFIKPSASDPNAPNSN